MDLLQSNWVAACEKARVPARSLRVSPKRGARMLAAIAALLVCQLIGEAAVRAVDLPFPGPGVCMILLLVLMLARAPLPVALGNTADGLLQHLSLLFVPAGGGGGRDPEFAHGARGGPPG